jgi:hypothetical protein
MRTIATSLFAALALAGSVAHVGSPTFGNPDNVPYQGVYAPTAVAPAAALAAFATNDEAGPGAAYRGSAHGDAGQSVLAAGGGSDDSTQTMLADGGGSDDAGQTMLARGGDSDAGAVLLAAGPEDGSTQLA